MPTVTTTRPGPARPLTVPAAGGRPWWLRRRVTVPAAAVLAVLSGVVSAWLAPRGPTSPAGALTLMAAALAVGALVGVLLRSRWAVPLAPLAHLAGFELARATVFDVPGVVFGAVHLAGIGLLLLAVGHLMYLLVAGAPMALGAIVGAAWARRQAGAPRRLGFLAGTVRVTAILLTLLLAVGVGTLASAFARTGDVAPVAAGGIAVKERVRLGGTDQWISIRGTDARNPVLLYLSGGPGGSDAGYVRRFNRALEDHFTVVVWEQRGAGASYAAIDPAGTFTLDRIVTDGTDLARLLAARFGQQKVYLVGNSWGSTLGVLMAQRHPELFHAYVGTGQMVSQRQTDRILYGQALAWAERTGDTGLAGRLRAWGPPPYDDPMTDALEHGALLDLYATLEPYPRPPGMPAGNLLATRFFHGEYGLMDSWNALRGLPDMFSVLYPQLQGIDFRADVPRLEVPVYVFEGRHELRARRELAVAWFEGLRAPAKRLIWFEYAGHNPESEEAARFNQLMVEEVLASRG